MTRDERLKFLRNRVTRRKREIAEEVLRISEDNSIATGSINNLVNLHGDLVEIRALSHLFQVEVNDER